MKKAVLTMYDEVIENMKRKRHSKREYTVLSKREQQILVLIAKGYKKKEVAEKLNISVKTAENHKTNIMKKSEAASIKDLFDCASRNRLPDLYTF